MSLLRTVRRAARLFDRRTRRWLAALAVAGVALALLDLIGLLLLAPLLAEVTGGGAVNDAGVLSALVGGATREEAIVRLTLLAAGAFLAKGILAIVLIRAQTGVLVRGQEVLMARLFSTFQAAGWIKQQAVRPGEFIRTTTTSVLNLAFLLTSALSAIADSAVFLSVLIAVAVVDPLLAVAALVYLGILGSAYVSIVKRPLERRGREVQVEAERVNSAVLDLVGGIRELSVRGQVLPYRARALAALRAYLNAGRLITITNYGMRFFLETLMIVGVAILIVFVALLAESLESALVAVGVLLAGGIRLLPALNTVLVSVNSIRAYAPSIDVVEGEFTRLEADPAESENCANPGRPIDLSATVTAIAVRDVSFSYPARAAKAVIDLDFSIEKGESVGVVGASGAGKSTLMDLVLGLVQPDEGSVQVFGEPLPAALEAWRRSLGYVPQDIYLLADTLAANIRFGIKPGPDDAELMRFALDVANLNPLVEDLPEGLDTYLGERGVLLSGGQRQRIGLARALYGRPSVLLLDEATSALDNETEHLISEALRRLKGDLTIVIVAHRLSTVRECDRIIFMHEGRIEQIGTFDELQRTSAQFARLVELGSLRD